MFSYIHCFPFFLSSLLVLSFRTGLEIGNGISLCKTEDLFSDHDLATSDSNSSSSPCSSPSATSVHKASLNQILPSFVSEQQQQQQQPPKPKRIKLEESPSDTSSSPSSSSFSTFIDALLFDLFSCKWETRHGAAIGLRSVLRHRVSGCDTSLQLTRGSHWTKISLTPPGEWM